MPIFLKWLPKYWQWLFLKFPITYIEANFVSMKDLKFTDDLVIKDGDFVIDDSDNQHQKDILVAYKGEYKLNPELGVGIDVLLKEDDVTAILIEAKKNLMYDGVDVKNIYFSDQAKLIIDGKYIK